jgi:PAS domain S-box-containing protein
MQEMGDFKEGKASSMCSPLELLEDDDDRHNRWYFCCGVGLLALVGVMDVHKPLDRSWSMLYLLIVPYATRFVRGRAEIALLASTIAAVYLIPAFFRMELIWPGGGLFYRTTGVIVGLGLLGLLWQRRRIVKSLQEMNGELEKKVVLRTSELQLLNDKLLREISERHQVEESNRKISEFRETLIRTAAEGICVCYPIPVHPYVAFSVWNQQMTEITGYDIHEINRLGWYQTVYPDSAYREKVKERIDRIWQGEHYGSEEREIVRKDGQRRTICVSTSSVEIESGIHGIVGFIQDVTESKAAVESLRVSHQRLERLSRQLIEIQESERRHLARELHDEIGQVLTAIKMNLRHPQRSADAATQPMLEDNLKMIDQAISQVRNLSISLRPLQLDELGLAAALHWLLNQKMTGSGIECHLDFPQGDVKIPPNVETACFRIAQEAVTNALRHASPHHIDVKLFLRDDHLHLSIEDDGIGFSVQESYQRALSGSSFGLIGMQERASMVGARFEIQSNPQSGTKIEARFPLTQTS